MQSPVQIVTVEREYGSRGGEFAHDLAQRLGWKLLDSKLVERAARAAGVSPELASRFDERLDPWYYRYGKIFWHDVAFPMAGLTEQQVFDSERLFELMRDEVLEAAKEGHCVIVGRGAACALACHPGCFHVFVYATSRAKREWFQAAFPSQAQHADQLLADMDKRRAAAIRQFYQQDWCSRSLYHMLLNSAMGKEAMIQAVTGAAGLAEAAGVGAQRAIGIAGETC
jgi:cytidylate kinase